MYSADTEYRMGNRYILSIRPIHQVVDEARLVKI